MDDKNGFTLPAEVLQAIERGDLIQAIKRLREATGLGLKEAKDAVEAHRRGDAVELPSPEPVGAAAGMHDVQRALQAGNKIEAIRLLRELTGSGLKEAKDQVEAMERVMPRSAANVATDLAPGEVRRSSGAWWIVLVVALAGGAYWFLR